MKILLVLFIFTINFSACEWQLFNDNRGSKNKAVSFDETAINIDCGKEIHKHKSETEIAAMPPTQLIDEDVSEQLHHMPALGDHYGFLISKYILEKGAKMLPILTEYMNDYDPKSSSRCKEMRFHVAMGELSDIDNRVTRLRATKEGQLSINSLERAIERMRAAGFDKGEYERKSNFDFALHNFEMIKGTNISDEMIRSTLQARHKVEMTESEYLEFSNFLTSLDPTYPTWSEVGEYGPPTILKESKKYYEAYLKFKGKK